MKNIGFIGCGNMGGAIIGGIINSGITQPENIVVYDKSAISIEGVRGKYNITVAKDEKDAAKRSDVLFLAVKPSVIYDVIDDIKACISNNTVVVSIAAGQSIEKIENAFGKKVSLMRVMPNTPALVGEGMSALSPNSVLDKDEAAKEYIMRIFSGIGKAELVPEKLMDAVTGVSGSSPAYVFMFIEALADAAVLAGMPRNQSYTFAAQAVLGSAKMVLETGLHPGELKDMVCSPGGTTIEAVSVLEEKGMRSSVLEAVKACVEKSKKL